MSCLNSRENLCKSKAMKTCFQMAEAQPSLSKCAGGDAAELSEELGIRGEELASAFFNQTT